MKIIYVFLSLFFLSLSLSANDNETRVDRETSFRKSIDTFGKVDQKVVSGVKKSKQMLRNGEVTGQFRSIYAGYNQKKAGEIDTYATAIGGMLKYELASFNGFHAAAALSASQDIGFATGDTLTSKQNDELSSAKGSYIALSEAYVNYANGGLNIRLGRQMIDTPLADTDDSRMIPNTFEAYMLTYEFNKILFTLGNVQRWQGSGAGLGYIDSVKQNTNWLDTKGSGTSMIGISYEEVLKFNSWYYHIQKPQNASKASYLEFGYHKKGAIALHTSIQYLHESEMKNSGIKADIYGGVVELVIYDLNLNVAYNKSKKHLGKRSFSGIGGGSLYTSMDTMLLDEIANDRDADALVFGLEYTLDNGKLIYAYGDFNGDANSIGESVHIVEHNLGVEYNINSSFALAAIYVREEDKQSATKTTNDWDRAQVMLTYNF